MVILSLRFTKKVLYVRDQDTKVQAEEEERAAAGCKKESLVESRCQNSLTSKMRHPAATRLVL